MEVFAGASALTIFILVIIFLCALPGLVTGWMLKASGRSFFWGFVLGLVFGPLGFLVALIFLLVGKPQQQQQPQIGYVAPVQQQAYQEPAPYYAPPPPNNSVPWAIAAVAIVVGFAALGVAGYVISNSQRPTNALQPAFTSFAPVQPTHPVAAIPTPPPFAATPMPTATLAVEVTATPSPEVAAAPVTVETVPAPPGDGISPSDAASVETAEATRPMQLSAQDREEFIAGTQEALRDRGIAAIVEFTGADKSMLSIFSNSFTRPMAERWLEAPKTRPGLKAVGIRSVVIINDSGSWNVNL